MPPDPTLETKDVERRAGRDWPLMVASLAALVWFLAWVRHFFLSDYHAIATAIQDDSYYYLLPAWNFSRLGWFTFDGVTTTYGFQPLWEIILSVVGSMMGSREQFLRVTLAISALLYATASVMTALAARAVWRSRRPSGGSAALVFAAAAMLLNPEFSVANLTGKENALYAVIFSSLIVISLSVSPTRPLRGKYGSGCLAGAALLSRLTPMSVVAVAASYWPLIRYGSRRRLLGNIAAAVLVMLPWLVYSTLAFGSVMPTSGRVKMEGFWGAVPTDPDGLGLLYHATVGYLAAVARFALGFMSPLSSIGPPSGDPQRMVFALMGVAGAAWVLWSRQTYLVLLIGGLIAAYAAMPLLMYKHRDDIYYFTWYIVEIPIIAAILVGAGVEFILDSLRRYSSALRLTATVALIVVTLTAVPGALSLAQPKLDYVDQGHWQDVMLTATLWINTELHEPAGTRVAAGNCGLLGWFSKYTVVNLDGLANDDIVAFTRAGGNYASYCKRLGVTVYADVGAPDQLFPEFTIRQTFVMPGNRDWPTFYVAMLPAK